MAAKKKKVKKKAPSKKKDKGIVKKGKRKRSIARASIKKGSGRVRVNSNSLDSYSNKYLKAIISEPLNLAGTLANDVDVQVNVMGGGEFGQAQACRSAIAKALVVYSSDDDLRKRMLERDRSLLVDDVRRVEPKKYQGPKARARFQKSYR